MKNISVKQGLLMMLGMSVVIACSNEPKPIKKTETKVEEVQAYKQVSPNFNADSAYNYVKAQVDFGPRVNNTPAHIKCGDWMVKELKKFGATVTEQKTIIPFRGKQLQARNIIGAINPKATKRILLCSHWDSRPYGDKDVVDKDKPILGANDGASGVGVLLEIARILQANPVNVGIDIVFFDAEDLGLEEVENSWCLGSEYWSTHLHEPNYKADFGLLLDMVGAPNAKFPWEGISNEYGKTVLETVWATAQQLGYGNYFIYYQIGPIEDDHYHVIKNTKIPVVDIIHYDPTTNSFPDHHHTHRDNMSVIDRNTLKAVGQTILETIYKMGSSF